MATHGHKRYKGLWNLRRKDGGGKKILILKICYGDLSNSLRNVLDSVRHMVGTQ